MTSFKRNFLRALRRPDLRHGRPLFHRRWLVGSVGCLAALAWNPVARAADDPTRATTQPAPLTLPAWLRQDGLVMAGNWESLGYRVRSGRLTQPGEEEVSDQAFADLEGEFSDAMAQRLKEAGVNFAMVPLAKGLGPKHELRQREISRRFAATCHRLGLHVGVYISGTIFYESLLSEYPDADAWCVRQPDGQYDYYNWSDTRMYYRRRLNRDHPGARAYYRELVRIAIQEIHADLIHLDNYGDGAPGYEAYSVQRFREFLARKYTPAQRLARFGFSEVDHIEPPITPGPRAPVSPTSWVSDPLLRDFIDYRAAMQADAYRDLAAYARSLDPDVMMECNPGGYERPMDLTALPTNDHLRLVPGGNAFWDEGRPSGLLADERLHSRFRTLLLARQFNNLVFFYTSQPVAMAESFALGLQCAGCPFSFDRGELHPEAAGRQATIAPALFDYIRFFRQHQDLYRDAELVADVGVVNSFGDNCFAPLDDRRRASAVEQSLYQGRVPFTIVPAGSPGDLGRYRALVLADMYYVPEGLAQALHVYVHNGGGLVLTGRAGRFADLFPTPPQSQAERVSAGRGRVVFLPEVELPEPLGKPARNHDQIMDAVRWAAGGNLSVEVDAPLTTTMAFYRKGDGHCVLHLVNYDEAQPLADVPVSLPASFRTATVLSPDEPAPVTVPVRSEQSRTTFHIPRLKTYAVVELGN